MSETYKICRCGHDEKEHFSGEGLINTPCVFRYLNEPNKHCGCAEFAPESVLHTIISVYRLDRFNYRVNQIEAAELNAAEIAKIVDEQQRDMDVPDVLEELLSIKNYHFTDLPPLEEKDFASVIAKRLYPKNRFKVDWRLRDTLKEKVAETVNEQPAAIVCRCGHARDRHDRGFDECALCEVGECLEFNLEIKVASAVGGN